MTTWNTDELRAPALRRPTDAERAALVADRLARLERLAALQEARIRALEAALGRPGVGGVRNGAEIDEGGAGRGA